MVPARPRYSSGYVVRRIPLARETAIVVLMEWGLDDLEASTAGRHAPARPDQVSSKAFNVLVFLTLSLALVALAFLCAEYHVSKLEQTLEAPAEVP